MRTNFNRDDAFALACETLLKPPARSHIERHEGVGQLVWQCLLPLELCIGVNRYAEMAKWKLKRVKREALVKMGSQLSFRRWPRPLPGRPMVRCIRFSSVEPDHHSAWSKIPVDRLTVANGGLGFLQDDRPSLLELRTWWEPAPPGKGFTLVQVWTGKADR